MEAEIQTPLDLIECDPARKMSRALWSMCVLFTGGVKTMEVGFFWVLPDSCFGASRKFGLGNEVCAVWHATNPAVCNLLSKLCKLCVVCKCSVCIEYPNDPAEYVC